MANRPIFMISDKKPYVIEKKVDFEFYSGFSEKQKKKSIDSLHKAFLKNNPNEKILEISSKSDDEIGIKLSAFNLIIEEKNGRKYSLESAFQASKVFENGGPFIDLLDKSSKEAKKDERLKNSGRIKYFKFGDRIFDLNPTTFFYNWLYINTLNLYPSLCEELVNYSAFTDIVFNPDKSINCQAKAAAVYVSLYKAGLLQNALTNRDEFLRIVYGDTKSETENFEQITLWDKL